MDRAQAEVAAKKRREEALLGEYGNCAKVALDTNEPQRAIAWALIGLLAEKRLERL